MDTKNRVNNDGMIVFIIFACVFCLMFGAVWMGKIFHKPTYSRIIVSHIELDRYPVYEHEKWDGRDARLEYEKACERIKEGTDTEKDHDTWVDYTRENVS
jgi:hypothetical protein